MTTVAVETGQVLHFVSVSVALVIHHARRMRHIIFSSVASPVLPHFSVKFGFRFSPQSLSETLLTLRKIQQYIINVHRSSRIAPVNLV